MRGEREDGERGRRKIEKGKNSERQIERKGVRSGRESEREKEKKRKRESEKRSFRSGCSEEEKAMPTS
jgi:hypothetical protein